jgi:hypothetical protein
MRLFVHLSPVTASLSGPNIRLNTLFSSTLSFVVSWRWGETESIGLLYQSRMIDDERGAVCGIRIGRGNRSTRRKPGPMPLCPPQIQHDLIWV